jgi:thiamine-monophosphate kinase
MTERARIARIAELLGGGGEGVDVGIGDDAAVLSAPPGGKLVWTVDEQVEGVHFRREWLSWRDLGWRSFMAAASDLGAMGATPWCALSALVLPPDVDDAALEQLVEGQRAATQEVGAPIVGGNLSRGPVVSIATTLLGTCERAVTRSGARVGDGLWLAGRLGFAAAGLGALASGRGGDLRLVDAVAAWRSPRALVAEGNALRSLANACVDVSDGLACDVGHLAEASGVAVVLDEAALRGQPGLGEAAAALGRDELDLVLHGGEDYALVVASPAAIPGFRPIGACRAGRGVVLRSASGERGVEPRGFDHFQWPRLPP